MSGKEIFIPILHDAGALPEVIREISAGLEEEGVPFRVQQRSPMRLGEAGNAVPSSLQVFITIQQDGTLSLFHEKLAGCPYLKDSWQYARRLGKNAARVVKGLPLYLSERG